MAQLTVISFQSYRRGFRAHARAAMEGMACPFLAKVRIALAKSLIQQLFRHRRMYSWHAQCLSLCILVCLTFPDSAGRTPCVTTQLVRCPDELFSFRGPCRFILLHLSKWLHWHWQSIQS